MTTRAPVLISLDRTVLIHLAKRKSEALIRISLEKAVDSSFKVVVPLKPEKGRHFGSIWENSFQFILRAGDSQTSQTDQAIVLVVCRSVGLLENVQLVPTWKQTKKIKIKNLYESCNF
jgi:hypothetical protein